MAIGKCRGPYGDGECFDLKAGSWTGETHVELWTALNGKDVLMCIPCTHTVDDRQAAEDRVDMLTGWAGAVFSEEMAASMSSIWGEGGAEGAVQ